MTPKRTPGPWHVGEPDAKWYFDEAVIVFDAEGVPVADCNSRADSLHRTQHERRANARLIAASPDLYHVAKSLTAALRGRSFRGGPEPMVCEELNLLFYRLGCILEAVDKCEVSE